MLIRAEVEKLNRQAIAEGLMLPGGQSNREDFSKNLGESLSTLENKAYLLICSSIKDPINTQQLYKEIYGACSNTENDLACVWALVSKIKQKLGKESLIKQNGGYLSRRKIIESGLKPPLNS